MKILDTECHSISLSFGTDVRQSINYQPNRWQMKMLDTDYYSISLSNVRYKCKIKSKLPAQQMANEDVRHRLLLYQSVTR